MGYIYIAIPTFITLLIGARAGWKYRASLMIPPHDGLYWIKNKGGSWHRANWSGGLYRLVDSTFTVLPKDVYDFTDKEEEPTI